MYTFSNINSTYPTWHYSMFCTTSQREYIAFESCSGTLSWHNIMILNLDRLVSCKTLHCKKSGQNCNMNIMALWCMNLSSGITQLVTWQRFYFTPILNDRRLDFIIITVLFFVYIFNLPFWYKVSYLETGYMKFTMG